MIPKEIKVLTNAIHSVERSGKNLWFYHYRMHNNKLVRAQLPFCILPLEGIERIDICNNYEKYNTDFHYITGGSKQRIEWYYSDIYSAGGGWEHSEWRTETEEQIKKVLDIVGNSGNLK